MQLIIQTVWSSGFIKSSTHFNNEAVLVKLPLCCVCMEISCVDLTDVMYLQGIAWSESVVQIHRNFANFVKVTRLHGSLNPMSVNLADSV